MKARGVLVKNVEPDASAPRRVPAPHGRRAGGKYAHDPGPARESSMNAPLPASLVAPRRASIRRDTKETKIGVSVDLDGTGAAKLSTGIGFFDHMLDQIARHGPIDLEIDAPGRPAHRRPSHGRGRRHRARPWPSRRRWRQGGLTRYGHAYVPLDEALSRVVIDFSGRPGPRHERALQGRHDRRLRRPAGARILPGLRQPRPRHPAHRQPARRERPPPVRDGLQGLRAGAALGGRARSAPWATSCRRRRGRCSYLRDAMS